MLINWLKRSTAWFRSAAATRADAKKRVRLSGWERLEDRTVPSAGTLDPAFGSAGKVTYDVIPADLVEVDSAVQSNGKIVTVGLIPGAGFNIEDSVITRRNADGSLDTTFNGVGFNAVNFANFEEFRAVAIQADGKIVAGGTDEAGRFTFARFNTDGTLDSTFDGDGVVAWGVGGEEVWDLVIQPDGKILAAGYLDGDLGLIRLNSDGSLDTGFGITGVTGIDSGPFAAYFSAVGLQPDGKIVAAGHQVDVFQNDDLLIIARFNADGTLDTTFDGDGVVRTVFRTSDFSDHLENLAIQPDGKLLFVGHSGIDAGVTADFGVLRLLPNGDRDPDFGVNGVVLSNYNEIHAWGRGIALETNGQILIVGQIATGDVNTVNSLITRLNEDGSVDTTFGAEPSLGRTIVDFVPGGSDGFNQVHVLSGRILASGYVRNQSTTLARFLNPPPTTVNEGAQAVRSGSLADFGGDVVSFSATVGNVTQNTQAGTWTWTFNTTDGPDDTQVVTITATHSDNSQSAIAFGLVVNNVAPTVARTGPATVTLDEGEQGSNAGTFADVGNDVVNVTASIGTITKTGSQNGTWTWSFTAGDGPNQTQTVTITATDSDGAQSTTTFNLVVNNVVPTVALSGNPQVNKLAPYTLNLGAITDPGQDTVTGYQVHWGDGQISGFIPIGNRFPQHFYQLPGNYTIHVDLFDEDGTHLNAGQTQVQVIDAAPDLSVTQTSNQARVRRGRAVTFRITVVNNGNSFASGVSVTYRIPAGLTFLRTGSTSGWRETSRRLFRKNLGAVGVGESVTLVFRARVATTVRRGAILRTTATVNSDGLQGPDANFADNVSKISIRAR